MDSVKNLIDHHMTKLCEEIGARATGSDANKAAVKYVAEVFEKLGLNVTMQEFPCMDWKNDGAQLTVDGVTIDAEAAEYSLPCDVTGELVCVGTVEELKGAELDGKICVMHSDLCKEPLMPKSFTFWNPKEHQEIIRELEIKKPLAVITVSYLEDVAVPIIQDGDFMIPCAATKGSNLNVLLAGSRASLLLKTERKSSTASNVIAIYGSGSKKVSFSAHIDTKPATPGALDNGSGVSALLALAAQVVGTNYPYQIEFVLFNGEDYYSTKGEIVYMDSYLQSPGDYVCAFNVDGVGMQDSKTSYSFYECSKELQKRVEAFAQNYANIEKIDPWPMGDHMLFASAGVPAVAVTASNIFMLMESVMHTPQDNRSIVDMDKIAETVSFLHGCI